MQIRSIIKRLLLLILILLSIVIGWYLIVRIISPWNVIKIMTLTEEPPLKQAAETRVLRIGCYNIAHGRGGAFGATNWDGGDRAAKIERVKQIGRLLKEQQLEIVVLNEVDFSSFWSGHFDQAKTIAEEAGFPYLLEVRNVDVAIPFLSIRFGNAVLSKYPIVDAKKVNFPNYVKISELFIGGVKEGAICTVQLPGGNRVRILPVHLTPYNEGTRVACARKILETQQESDIPLIALGDFNAAPTGYPAFYADESGNNAIDELLKSGRLTTLPLGTPANPKDFTFPSEKPGQVIDWVFVSSPWQIAERTVLSSDLSDHLPVVALLKY